MAKALRHWIAFLFKRVLALLSVLASQFRGRQTTTSVKTDEKPSLVPLSVQSPPAVKNITQEVVGDHNPVIGSISPNSFVNIDQSNHYYERSSSSTDKISSFGVPYQRNCYFVGRELEITRLHQQLHQTRGIAISQPVAVTGLGGIGKTQVVVEYAYRYYYDQTLYSAVFWVRSDTEVNLASSFASIASQLSLPVNQSTQAEKISAVQRWLMSNDDWLLVFDSADEPSWLIDFIPTNPKGKVLITSRVNVLDQIGIRASIMLSFLPVDEAVELLFGRTGQERTDSNTAAAIQLSQELDGLPLALEQASAFVVRKRIGFQAYINIYNTRGLAHLEKVTAQTGQYKSSVAKTWAINFQAVTEENPLSRDLLEFSAFLAPDLIPYVIPMAGAVGFSDFWSTSPDRDNFDEAILMMHELIEPLSKYSLVEWYAARHFYRVHRLVQTVVIDGMSVTTRQSILSKVSSAIATLSPENDFKNWRYLSLLVPHSLQVIEAANRENFRSKSLIEILNQIAIYFQEQGVFSGIEKLHEQALALSKQFYGADHYFVGRSMNNLAVLYQAQGRFSESIELAEEALALLTNLYGDENQFVASSQHNLAHTYSEQERYDESELLFKKALGTYRKLYGDEHQNTASTLSGLGMLYLSQCRYKEAEDTTQEALTLKKRILGDEHPHIANSLSNLALVYEAQERYEEAIIVYEECLDMTERLLGNMHPAFASTSNSLATVYRKQGLYKKAEDMHNKALFSLETRLGSQHPRVLAVVDEIARTLAMQRRFSEAHDLAKKVLLVRQQLFGFGDISVAQSLVTIAGCYREEKRYDEAESSYQQAVSLLSSSLGSSHPTTILIGDSLRRCKEEHLKAVSEK